MWEFFAWWIKQIHSKKAASSVFEACWGIKPVFGWTTTHCYMVDKEGDNEGSCVGADKSLATIEYSSCVLLWLEWSWLMLVLPSVSHAKHQSSWRWFQNIYQYKDTWFLLNLAVLRIIVQQEQERRGIMTLQRFESLEAYSTLLLHCVSIALDKSTKRRISVFSFCWH